MNNGVNDTNNLNNQTANVEPILQPLPSAIDNSVQPVLQPIAVDNNQNQTPVLQPIQQVAPQPVVAPTAVLQPEVLSSTSAPVVVAEGDNTMPVESGEVIQNIPGVIVAPPQNGGTDKPNPIAPLPGSEVKEEVVEEVKEEVVAPIVEDTGKKKKKKNILARLFFFIIICLAGLIYYMDYNHKMVVAKMTDECTPVSTTKDTKQLELDSTIVSDLYSKVKTTLREDLAEMQLTDQMKIYLAFKQIPESKFYDSNCNLFSDTAMEPYKCVETLTTMPKAFKEEDLKIEIKKLFGETAEVTLQNVQLGKNTCLGGYQYIPERGDFVQGECTNKTGTTFKMDKKLVKAESRKSTITLYEEVKYYNAEGIDLPEALKSGTYVYTFKLDSNYNYVYISKVLQEK